MKRVEKGDQRRITYDFQYIYQKAGYLDRRIACAIPDWRYLYF